ncbi:hypothetical protein [Nocardia lasii]|uniref:TPR repeat domain-containing protein n=1 Tax=Nocardia lasii TaxID=1616107 RepID=A0ABW1K0C3_9NOCA
MSPVPPTISQVRSWQPATVIAAGTAIVTGGEALNDRMAAVDLAVDQTAVGWQGEAASTASMRAVSELLSSSQTRRAAVSIGETFKTQGGVIDGHRSALISAVEIIAGGYPSLNIADDGTVTAPALSGDQAANLTLVVLNQKLVNAAADYTITLKEHLSNIASACASLKFAAALGLTDLDQHGGPGGAMSGPSGLSGDQGTKIGQQISDATNNGKQIPDEVLDQLADDLKAAGVSPEQQAAYLRGEDVTMPAASKAYLQNLMNAAGADGFTQASQQLQQQGPAGEQAARSLANGALLLSNEKVGTGRDSNGKLTGAGSYENLPQDMRDLISTRVSAGGGAPDANASDYPIEATGATKTGEFVNRQSELLAALGMAETGNDPGVKMSTELQRQGAHMAWLDQNNSNFADANIPADDVINRSIELGARNADGVTAILTGEGGPDILGTGYDPEKAVLPLLTHEGQPGDQPAITPITNWISENAGATSPESELAGKSAHGLTQIISATDNYEGLLAGTGPGQTGGMTAGTSQEVAEALAPYVGRMVDMPEAMTDTKGFSDLTPVESVQVFSVLSGDPLSSATINGAALAESQRMDSAFLANGNTENGNYANRLEWLVNQGIGVDYDQQVAANETAAEDKTTKLNQAYTAGQIMVGGLGPGPAAIAALAEPGKSFLTVDPEKVGPYTPLKIDTGNYDAPNFGSANDRSYRMVQTLVENGQVDFNSLPPEFKDGDRLKTYSDYSATTQGNPGYDNSVKLKEILIASGVNGERLDSYIARANNGEAIELQSSLRPPDSDQQQRISERLAMKESQTSVHNRWVR